MTNDPFFRLGAALLANAVLEGDVKFFDTRLGKTVCDCADIPYDMAIKKAIHYREKRKNRICYFYCSPGVLAVYWKKMNIGQILRLDGIFYLAAKDGRMLDFVPYRNRRDAALKLVEMWEVS